MWKKRCWMVLFCQSRNCPVIIDNNILSEKALDRWLFLVLASGKSVHQHYLGESLCCLPPPGTCKPTFSPCIQLTCEDPSHTVPDWALSAEPPCQAAALLQVHKKFGIASKYTLLHAGSKLMNCFVSVQCSRLRCAGEKLP